MIDPQAVHEAAERADSVLDVAARQADAVTDAIAAGGHALPEDAALATAQVAIAAQLRALRLALVGAVEQHARTVAK